MRLLYTLFICILFSLVSTGCRHGDRVSVPDEFKVAFIGDQGPSANAISVLELIRDEGANMVLHQGDFDYQDNPDQWMQKIDGILGADFPYFASIGNHDVVAWQGYQSKLKTRLDQLKGVSCSGDIGVNAACTYKGIFFVLSGIGTLGSAHIDYMQTALANSKAHWKICSWHKNQHLMQVGNKPDEVGWEAYETCRRAGAFIATGHHHSYSRTYLMSRFEQQVIASFSDHLTLKPGESFAFVSGLAGVSINTQLDGLGSNPWWASVYTSAENANYGALFCTFNPNRNETEANCYFKDIAGNIVDSFVLISELY
ncbi:MAG: metallophosphoesterase [Gammaproteobacteria bacterium]|nr:metallophosphoesterase [Gammaproteobacteria bacterium]